MTTNIFLQDFDNFLSHAEYFVSNISVKEMYKMQFVIFLMLAACLSVLTYTFRKFFKDNEFFQASIAISIMIIAAAILYLISKMLF